MPNLTKPYHGVYANVAHFLDWVAQQFGYSGIGPDLSSVPYNRIFKSNLENLAQNVISLKVRGNVKKKKSLFKDIIQIKVDHPPSYPIFDKLFFDKF